jgi:prepilin-type N-terminal cleavage/methylation domain-containing protein
MVYFHNVAVSQWLPGSAQHLLLLDVAMSYRSATVPSSSRSRESGVTLVELMVVVAILALASAFAVPNYVAWNARHQLKQAITELYGNLNLARMAAMNRNTTVTIDLAAGVVDPSDGKPKITATFTDAGGASVIQPQRMRIAITGVTGAAQVRFNSRGLRVGGGTAVQAITLTNGKGLTYEIQVTPGGKVRWCFTSPCP